MEKCIIYLNFHCNCQCLCTCMYFQWLSLRLCLLLNLSTLLTWIIMFTSRHEQIKTMLTVLLSFHLFYSSCFFMQLFFLDGNFCIITYGIYFLQNRYLNRPIIELEIAAQEEMKIIELRLARLLESDIGSNAQVTSSTTPRGNNCFISYILFKEISDHHIIDIFMSLTLAFEMTTGKNVLLFFFLLDGQNLKEAI